ncbi:Protein spt10 [Saxophila tyrrhenica]|uniref:Protein spt10 n=1 Tax=Saxophila tyrrhenica TaxID=1690608 RepID=A0AAV9PG87_9PEZI|nr:Protein spt10 [Saxophila tyrrhenica]
MPAMLDDPTAPAVYRVSGPSPYPEPYGPLPPEITPRQVTLRDRTTIATLLPFSSPMQVPAKLTAYLCELLNREIEKGDTYPMMDPMPLSSFGPYWFANFGAIMVLGELDNTEDVLTMEAQGTDWTKQCLGSFYVKPNYPGRSSHVCNGGFLVTDASRNRGVGRLMGECYLDWAPKLGYSYSVFNLVYETNVASLRIWDALGFKRIGRVKGCGNLKSYPEQYIDAIIFGRELGGDSEDYITEERFDKIRFYLKTGTYPNGSDRAEKSRLRSAATHYRLIPAEDDLDEDKLMLKGKEVVSDPHKQYEIARTFHGYTHAGINKTTASISEKYHWVRIKETVSAAIRNCSECKDPTPKPRDPTNRERRTPAKNGDAGSSRPRRGSGSVVANGVQHLQVVAGADPDMVVDEQQQQQQQHSAPVAQMQRFEHYSVPVDPAIMHGMNSQWHESHAMILDPAPRDVEKEEEADMDARLRAELTATIMRDEEPGYPSHAPGTGPGQ